MRANLEFDFASGAAYLRLSNKVVDSTAEIDLNVICDFDKNDGVIGIEFLEFASTPITEYEFLFYSLSTLITEEQLAEVKELIKEAEEKYGF